MDNGTLAEFEQSLKEMDDRNKKCNCNSERLVTIGYKKLKYLLYRDKELAALEKLGVDNWVGYGDAMKYYQELINDL